MAESFNIDKHSRRVYWLCKRMRAAWNRGRITRARACCLALRREIDRRPAWFIAQLEQDRGLAS